jgi:hypothetical protein
MAERRFAPISNDRYSRFLRLAQEGSSLHLRYVQDDKLKNRQSTMDGAGEAAVVTGTATPPDRA